MKVTCSGFAFRTSRFHKRRLSQGDNAGVAGRRCDRYAGAVTGSIENEYEFAVFQPGMDGERAEEATAQWLRAKELGFHAGVRDDEHIAWSARNRIADNRTLYAIYDRTMPVTGWQAPVATLDSFPKSFNVGGGFVTAHLVSGITVRPTHRRRGMLRTMLTRNLADAVEAGLPVALLTATEGGIYRRFGFGPATFRRQITVKTPRFSLLEQPSGRVEITDASNLVELAPRVFSRFHASQPGSVDRQAAMFDLISGNVGDDGKPDRAIRAALHYDTSGAIDGYVSYKFEDANTDPPSITVVDLVAGDGNAYLSLWNFLASIDLVGRVTFELAPTEDPLAWALTDARVVTTTGEEDMLWLRVLDPIALLGSRQYNSRDSVVIRVDDPLEYARGSFRVDATGEQVRVEDAGDDEPFDIRCDAADFASLYLGTTLPATLAAAGLLTEGRTGGVERASALLRASRPVHCISGF